MAPNIDHYDRKITYLRVSVTDRCNLCCVYCHPVKNFKLLKHTEILTYEEILTGGEPLVRRNFTHLVASLCRLPGINEVCITTNGVFLKKRAQGLFDAGVRRINVSLDTLNPLKYARITGRPLFQEVWEGIETAQEVGFSPIKLNVVAIRGFNDDELLRFARLSLERPFHIRFIEYMPIGPDTRWRPEKYISSDEIKLRLQSFGNLHEIPRSSVDGPAERYRFESAQGEIGFISPLSHHFCPSCNRLRLLANGKLRPCLFADDEVDVKSALRNGCSSEDLKTLFRKAIAKKPKEHNAPTLERDQSLRPMFAIGG
jgi:cyclic pyranopterin phosphate synthase